MHEQCRCTAAELVRVSVHAALRDAHALEQMCQLFLYRLEIFHAPVSQRYRNDLPHGLARIERRIGILKDHLNVALEAERGEAAAVHRQRFF